MGNTGKQPKRGRPAKREKSSNAKSIKTVKQNARTGGDEIQKKEKVTAYMATFPSREPLIGEVVESLINQVDKLVIWVNGDMELPEQCYNEKIELYFGKDVLGFDIGCAASLLSHLNGRVIFLPLMTTLFILLITLKKALPK